MHAREWGGAGACTYLVCFDTSVSAMCSIREAFFNVDVLVIVWLNILEADMMLIHTVEDTYYKWRVHVIRNLADRNDCSWVLALHAVQVQ